MRTILYMKTVTLSLLHSNKYISDHPSPFVFKIKNKKPVNMEIILDFQITALRDI